MKGIYLWENTWACELLLFQHSIHINLRFPTSCCVSAADVSPCARGHHWITSLGAEHSLKGRQIDSKKETERRE